MSRRWMLRRHAGAAGLPCWHPPSRSCGRGTRRGRCSCELEQLLPSATNSNIEWGRLQIEQSTLSNHGYVERVASKQRHLVMPRPDRDPGRRAMRRRNGEVEFDAGQFRLRCAAADGLLGVFALALFARSVQLQVLDRQFLTEQADMRQRARGEDVRESRFRVSIASVSRSPSARRSTPSGSIRRHCASRARASRSLPRRSSAIASGSSSASPAISTAIFSTSRGTWSPPARRRSRRSAFPASICCANTGATTRTADVTGHLLGFTNLDDVGQEGLELAFNQSLAGQHGLKKVVKDGKGRDHPEHRDHPAAATRRRPAHEHRPAHPVSGVPRAEVGGPRASCAGGFGRRAST